MMLYGNDNIVVDAAPRTQEIHDVIAAGTLCQSVVPPNGGQRKLT